MTGLVAGGVAACGAPPPAGLSSVPPFVVEMEDLIEVAGQAEWSGVRQVLAAGDGVWVLDGVAPFVTLLVFHGDSLVAVRRFGDEGDGPGELRDPKAMFATAAGADVIDPVMGRRVAFSRDGSVLGSHDLAAAGQGWTRPDLGEISHVDPWRARSLGERVVFGLYPGTVTAAEDLVRGRVTIGERDLTPGRALLDYAEEVPMDERASGPFPWLPLWDACDRGIVSWSPRSRQVAWKRANGSVSAQVDVPADGYVMTDEAIVRFLERMARHEMGPGAEVPLEVLRQRVNEVRDYFTAPAPPYSDLRCDADGSAWLRVFDMGDDALGRGATWYRVRPGSEAEVIRFPTEFSPRAFSESRVLGIVRTPTADRLAAWRRTVTPTSFSLY